MDKTLRHQYAKALVDSREKRILNGPDYQLLLAVRGDDLVLSAIPTMRDGKLFPVGNAEGLIDALGEAFHFLDKDPDMVDDALIHWQSGEYDEE